MKHKFDEPHDYEIRCKTCGEIGTLVVSVTPEQAAGENIKVEKRQRLAKVEIPQDPKIHHEIRKQDQKRKTHDD
jgi:hypothetical protein